MNEFMLFGIPDMLFLGILGAIAIAIWIYPSKKKSKGNVIAEGDIEGYVKSLQETTKMRWVKLRVNPEDLTTVLNMIEDLKVSVMYQFYLRENKYDMIFRCQKSKMEEFEKVMAEYI